jgi:hypothetical protein
MCHCWCLLQVSLRFSADFHSSWLHGRRHRVRFSIKRSTFVFMHEALALARQGELGEGLLLPPGMTSQQAAQAERSRQGVLGRVSSFFSGIQVGCLHQARACSACCISDRSAPVVCCSQ